MANGLSRPGQATKLEPGGLRAAGSEFDTKTTKDTKITKGPS
jgi:hypothetical protein